MKEQIQEDIAEIRHLMERSSRFLSLSGLSGVGAGVCGLAGTTAAWVHLGNAVPVWPPQAVWDPGLLRGFQEIAVLTLSAALGTGFFFTWAKSRRRKETVSGLAGRNWLLHLLVPLACGGVFLLVLAAKGQYDLLVPASLVFYGLGLLGASSYSWSGLQALGLLEILLGIASLRWTAADLMLWGAGFGLLHLIYGFRLWFTHR